MPNYAPEDGWYIHIPPKHEDKEILKEMLVEFAIRASKISKKPEWYFGKGAYGKPVISEHFAQDIRDMTYQIEQYPIERDNYDYPDDVVNDIETLEKSKRD